MFFVPFIVLFPFFTKEKKQRREVSINRPASYEPAALPLRHPASTLNLLLLLFIPFFYSYYLIQFFIYFLIYSKKIPSPGIEPGAQT